MSESLPYLCVFATALLAALAATPYARKIAWRVGAVDYPSAPETAWAGLSETARHAYAVRALAGLEEALRSPRVDEPGEVSP